MPGRPMIGTSISHYRIIARLGEGGMGEVFRAQDTRLDRDVAIKILPAAFAADPERLARFAREAKVLASLNHPGIATIHGLEDAQGAPALVMELVEGQTLGERLTRGPLPVDECIALALQMTEALEAAHGKGIVHRDLKPANIKLTPEGKVKLLDFGLAKALDPIGDLPSGAALANSPTLTHSPTLAAAGTALGVILGTAAYMAPEQARGRAVDKRADIWAFGVVLFEMLTGRQLFTGETVSDTLAAVLRADLDWKLLPGEAPPRLRDLLRRCLARDPARRLHDIADARLELEEVRDAPAGADAAAVSGASAGPGRAPATTRGRAWLWAAAAFIAGGVLVAAAGRLNSKPGATPASGAVTSAAFRQLTFLPGEEATPCLSPDGQSLVFEHHERDQSDLYLQRVDGRNPIPLTAGCPERDAEPAFSPDGQRIAYRSDCGGGGIFVMGATGESARRVADFGHSPAWSPDGRELALVSERPGLPTGRGTLSELWVVTLDSGARRRVAALDAMHPAWSPDGSRIVFWGVDRATDFRRDLWMVAARGSENEAVRLTDDAAIDWDPEWSPDGRWLYFSSTRGGTMNLWRLPTDPSTGRPAGPAEPVTAPSSWAGWISLARQGNRIAFVDRNVRTTLLRAPFDPAQGRLAGPPQPVELGSIEFGTEWLDISPDGEEILFSAVGPPQHLVAVRAAGGGLRQLTDGSDRNRQGSYSPDGSTIAFQTTRFGSSIAFMNPDGSGVREPFNDREGGWNPAWSPDGRQLAVSAEDGPYLLDPTATAPTGSTVSLPTPGPGSNFWPTSWSPDGRRLAGVVMEAGAPRATVVYSLDDRRFQILARDERLSAPRFLPDGRRIIRAFGRDLLVLGVADDEQRTIWSAPPGRTLGPCTLSRDGRWLVWSETANESDVWLMSLAP